VASTRGVLDAGPVSGSGGFYNIQPPEIPDSGIRIKRVKGEERNRVLTAAVNKLRSADECRRERRWE